MSKRVRSWKRLAGSAYEVEVEVTNAYTDGSSRIDRVQITVDEDDDADDIRRKLLRPETPLDALRGETLPDTPPAETQTSKRRRALELAQAYTAAKAIAADTSFSTRARTKMNVAAGALRTRLEALLG